MANQPRPKQGMVWQPKRMLRSPKATRWVGDPGMATPQIGSEVGALFFHRENNQQVTLHSSNPVSSIVIPSQVDNDLEKKFKQEVDCCEPKKWTDGQLQDPCTGSQPVCAL